jgi:hypothetical protein
VRRWLEALAHPSWYRMLGEEHRRTVEALEKARHYIRYGDGQQQNLKGERGDALRAVEDALGA